MHLLILSLIVLTCPTQAGELGEWEIKGTEEAGNVWSDYSESRPHLYPDAWSVDTLVRFDGEETMLKSSAGAMLRWVSVPRLRELYRTYREMLRVSEISASLYIIRGDTPNAAAGKREGRNVVFINFAMLDMINDDLDLWAALFGHELAHLKLAHADKQSKRGIPISILKTIGQAVIADPLTNAASGLLLDGVTATFSRKDEKQSDYMGVIWATEANYDPFGAVYLHQRMFEISSGMSIPFLDTHPSGPDRIENLRALAARLTGKSTLPGVDEP